MPLFPSCVHYWLLTLHWQAVYTLAALKSTSTILAPFKMLLHNFSRPTTVQYSSNTGLPPVLTVASLGVAHDQARGEDHQEVHHDGEEDARAGGKRDRVKVCALRSSWHGRRLSEQWLHWPFCSSFKDRICQPCGKSGEGYHQVSQKHNFTLVGFLWSLHKWIKATQYENQDPRTDCVTQ